MDFKSSFYKLGYFIDSLENKNAKLDAKVRFSKLDSNTQNYYFCCKSLNLKLPATLPAETINRKLSEAVLKDIIKNYGQNISEEELDSIFTKNYNIAKENSCFVKESKDENIIIYADGKAFNYTQNQYKDDKKDNLIMQDNFSFYYHNTNNQTPAYLIKTDVIKHIDMQLGLDRDLTKQYPCIFSLTDSRRYVGKAKVYQNETTATRAINSKFSSVTDKKIECKNGVLVKYQKTVVVNDNLEEKFNYSTVKAENKEMTFDMIEDEITTYTL